MLYTSAHTLLSRLWTTPMCSRRLIQRKSLPLELTYVFDSCSLFLLLISLQVPHAEGFSGMAQLHGGIIHELKKLHNKCPEHRNEHGEPGICYRCGDIHIILNMRRLAIWAAAIVSFFSPCVVRFVSNTPRGGRTCDYIPPSHQQTRVRWAS